MTEPAAPKRRIVVTIPGEPFSLKRARAARFGKFVRMHDAPENVSWKGTAGLWMLKARQDAGIAAPLAGPVALTIDAFFSCPKGDERKRDPRPERWSLSSKDLDNICKAVGDAGNGVLWADDRQVVSLVARKRIAAQGVVGCVLVDVTEVSDAS